jgi:hypothetical protein
MTDQPFSEKPTNQRTGQRTSYLHSINGSLNKIPEPPRALLILSFSKGLQLEVISN